MFAKLNHFPFSSPLIALITGSQASMMCTISSGSVSMLKSSIDPAFLLWIMIFSIFILLAIGFSLWGIILDYPQKAEVSRQLEDLEAKIAAVEKERERKERLADYLNSESYLEKQARLRLNLKKEGEEVVFVYRNEDSAKASESFDSIENPVLSKISEWVKILWPWTRE